MRLNRYVFIATLGLASAAIATPAPFSWKCKGGQVTAKVVKKNNASYSIHLINNSSETAHAFIEGYAKTQCNGCDQQGKIEGDRISIAARPGKKETKPIAATLLKLSRLDAEHFYYACGDQPFHNTKSKRPVQLHKKSGRHKALSGSDASRCINVTPARGHLVLKNTCKDAAQVVWCHLDSKLKYSKKQYCGRDGKGRYFTQAWVLKGGDTKRLGAYTPITPIRWGACRGTKLGVAGAWDGNGGYKCK